MTSIIVGSSTIGNSNVRPACTIEGPAERPDMCTTSCGERRALFRAVKRDRTRRQR